jgi:DNA-binding transcriptional ArsR family regulator
LMLLACRELRATEIAAHFDVTQPAISQHLKVLREVGLVSERREGTKRFLSVRPEGLAELNDFLATILPAGLERLKAAAEAEERRGRDARAARRN